MGKDNLGILLGDHVKALSPHSSQSYRISHNKHQGKGAQYVFAPGWEGEGKERE